MTRKIFALAICILTTILTVSAQTPPDNEIWYTTTDECKISITNLDDVASHTYVNGKGVIKFNNSVTEIGSWAFAECTSITSITIPDSVTEIGEGAFEGCTSLTSITIPDSVTGIGDGAFWRCTSLTSITIPDSVTEIGEWAFNDCTSLPIINKIRYADTYLVEAVDKSLTSYTIKAGTRFIENSAFEGCTSLTNITIPDSVTEIGDKAFRGCTSLTSINIPDSVTVIGGMAFEYCSSLTSITIPDSVTEIGGHAFSDCLSLTSITIPDSVTEIGSYAFYDCTSLTSINIPDSVTVIGEWTFKGCTSLESFLGKYSSADGRCLIKDVELIAFASAGLTSYTIPDCVTKIGWGAFEGCTSLTSITIPDSVTEIGFSAFRDCTSLTSITIPDSVTEIERSVFRGCTSLPIINKIRYADTYLVEAVDESLTSYTIKAGTRFIGNGAFEGCTSLTSITIPDSVTVIGEWAFYNCTNLTSITIPDSVTEIGVYAFKDCTSLTSITIPNSGIGIGWGAFGDCNIKQITISAVTGNIFRGCNGLDPSKVVAYTGKYASEDGRCLIKDGVLIDYIHNGAERYEIPNGVTIIGDEVFKGCSSLKEITIPNSVTMIGDGAFDGCNIERITINAVTGNIFEGCGALDPSKVVAYTGKYASEDGRCLIKDGVLIDFILGNLTSYAIPEGVKVINPEVFSHCYILTDITIPATVTQIGDNVFAGGSPELSITCLSTTPPHVETLGISEEAVIYVPKRSVKSYKKANVWMDYKKQIKRIKE